MVTVTLVVVAAALGGAAGTFVALLVALRVLRRRLGSMIPPGA